MNFIKPLSAVALVSVIFAAPAAAQVYNTSKSATFDVTIKIKEDCSITALPLTFEDPGLLETTVDARSELTIKCTNTTPYSIGLDGGTNGATVADRFMVASHDATLKIPYQLYQEAARTTIWGNTPGTDTFNDGRGTGVAQHYSVYGRILPQTTSPVPGNYKSTVTATVNF